MLSVNFNNSTRKPLVLVCPLDWGLGHTTRCIPLIHELREQGCNIVIGCNSIQKELLRQEFGNSVSYTHLAGYNISYGKSRSGTFARLAGQSLKILIKIKQEKRWLRELLQQQRVDAIFSDNRFGLYAPGIPSIFITHQLQIKTGLCRLADRLARQWNYRRLRRFNACWVPDEAGPSSLSGELSHPPQLPSLPVRYIGPLSRFTACPDPQSDSLLIILSGPEPQRSIFEGLLLAQLKDHPGKVVLVRGLPLSTSLPAVPDHCIVLNHAPAALLHSLICAAGLVISRCGYTTVMDLLALKKKAILVPTPGQAEQEYLAQHLQQQQWAYTQPQKGFRLALALAAAQDFSFRLPVFGMHRYQGVVRELTAGLHGSPVVNREFPPGLDKL